MKKKSILLILSFSAIVTFSFSFVGQSESKVEVQKIANSSSAQSEAPVGGFALEDQLEK